jgi:predicted HicB family RNase H-like nuclease
MGKRNQIAFDIDPEIRTQIKIVSARRNISMNLWLMRAIITALAKEKGLEETKPQRRKDW